MNQTHQARPNGSLARAASAAYEALPALLLAAALILPALAVLA